jgi:lipopolysaccharide biosynthesis glycosyltransferase
MSKRAVLLIADDKQFPPAVFLANRLAALRGGRDIDIILATNWPRGLAEAREFGGPFELMDLAGLAGDLDLPEVSYFTRATYYSLFVPPLLHKRYDRLLYLDVDIYPEGDRVFALFDLDLGRYPIAAVRDLNVPFWGSQFNIDELTATLRIPPGNFLGAKYLNSGVLLIDLAAYARDRIDKKAEKVIRDRRIKLQMPDQTVFNAVLRTGWLELSPSFNMITNAWASFIRQFSPPAIVHFTGPLKPWHRAFVDPHPVKRELAEFLKNTPWSSFIADVNPPPQLLGGELPPPPAPHLPLWRGIYLDALVRYLRETRFADVAQGLTRLDFSALPPQADGARKGGPVEAAPRNPVPRNSGSARNP